MKVCPHCHKDIPDDSIYCTYCGQAIENKNSQNEDKIIKKPQLKENPHHNIFGRLGVFLFFVGLFGFDFILATIVQNIVGNAQFVFIISTIIYSLAIICGLFCLYIDHKDKKKGYEPNGGIQFAILSIVMSLYTIIININAIFL